jgi:hypothetical protein
MALNPPPMPIDTPLVGKDRLMDWLWVQFFTSRDQRIESASQTVTTVALSTQAASIAATPINVSNAAALYRVNIYHRITRAATVSSSSELTIAWTEGGQALTKVYTALTANTVTTVQQEVTPVRVDANTSFTYAITYASVGATSMQFYLELEVERVA